MLDSVEINSHKYGIEQSRKKRSPTSVSCGTPREAFKTSDGLKVLTTDFAIVTLESHQLVVSDGFTTSALAHIVGRKRVVVRQWNHFDGFHGKRAVVTLGFIEAGEKPFPLGSVFDDISNQEIVCGV